MAVITNLKQLYEIDDAQWLEETVELLKDCQFGFYQTCEVKKLQKSYCERI